MSYQDAVPLPDGPRPRQGGRRRWWIAIAALLVVIVGGGAAVVAAQLLAATRTEFADAIPEDAVVFVHVDFLDFVRSDRLGRLIEAFDEDVVASDEIEDALAELDEEMLGELGFDFTNDILPWAGRGISFALTQLDVDSGRVDWVMTYDVRNQGAAEDFMPKLVAAVEQEAGPVSTTTRSGLTVYDPLNEPVAFALADGLLIAANDIDGIDDILAARDGTPLGENADFLAALAELPEDRIVTGYLDGARYAQLVQEEIYSAPELAPGSLEAIDALAADIDSLRAIGFSATLTDTAARFDAVTLFDESGPPAFFADWFSGTIMTPTMAPSNTIGYEAVPGLISSYTEWILSAFEGEPDLIEFRSEFASEFGFDVFDDLLLLLDGEFGIVVTRDETSILAQETGVPLAGAIYVGTSDEAAIRDRLESLLGTVAEEMELFGPAGQPQLYEVQIDDGIWIPFGVDDGFLMAASDRSIVEDLFDGGPSIAEEPVFQSARAELADGMEPFLFVDLTEIYSIFDEEDLPHGLDTFQGFMIGADTSDTVYRATAVLTLDY